MNTRMFLWRENKCDGLAAHMDIIVLNNDCVIYNKPIATAKTIFINTRLCHILILKFMNEILPHLSQPVNIVIAGEDYTFPNNTDVRMIRNSSPHQLNLFKELGHHKCIQRLFIENLDEELINAEAIPLGINSRECSVQADYFKKYENIDNTKSIKFTNFNRTRDGKGQWKERGDVLHLCKNAWADFFVETKETQHSDYLSTMGKYSFTLCVHGGGLDVNPKLWEALLIGVIPIIKENKPYTDIYIRMDLPVVIVKDWTSETITEKNLKWWHAKYYPYFTEKREEMMYYLSLDYWVHYIRSSKS